MTKNYLKKVIRYARKVYCIKEGIKALRDERKNPSYTTGEIILSILLGFVLRIQSSNELKYKIKLEAKVFINIRIGRKRIYFLCERIMLTKWSYVIEVVQSHLDAI